MLLISYPPAFLPPSTLFTLSTFQPAYQPSSPNSINPVNFNNPFNSPNLNISENFRISINSLYLMYES
jgi:hypothetical protein